MPIRGYKFCIRTENMGDVVSIFEKKKEKESAQADSDKKEAPLDLEAVAKRNEENRKRIEKERAEANKSVLRSHRLKGKDKKK